MTARTLDRWLPPILGFGTPAISSGKATLSITVRQGKVDSSWKIIPIEGCGPRTRSPATSTVP